MRFSGAQATVVMYLALIDGVFRSVDVGKSWTPVGEPLVNTEIRTIIVIEDVVFVGTDSGLYRRNSEGWTLLPIDEDHKTRNIRAMASAGHRLYVAVGDKVINHDFGLALPSKMVWETSLSLYRSTDSGNSWQTLDYKKTKIEPSSPIGMTIRVGSADPESIQNGKGGSKDAEMKPTLIFEIVAVEDNLPRIGRRKQLLFK